MTPPDPLQERIDGYLRDRADQYAGWYDVKAVKLKSAHLRSRVLAAVIAVIIPVLSTLSWTPAKLGFDVARVAVSIMGLLVAVLIALEGVLHYREQWKNYRSTEQYIRGQKYLFAHRVREYSAGSLEDAFKLFVANVEMAIQQENEVTLNVLSRAGTSETLLADQAGT